MRLATALAVLILTACHPATEAGPQPARCGPGVPETAQHPIAMRAASLSGEYELIQVQTQPKSGVARSGRLHLTPPDSASRAGAVGGAVRDLIGWLNPLGDGTRREIDAVLAGQHLRLGRLGDPDGVGQNLTITAVAPEGFWGWWKADRGLAVHIDPGTRRVVPDPAGYFCALRRDPAR